MKIKKVFKSMMLAASLLAVSGCSSLFDAGESGSEKKEDGFVINLGLNKQGARLIRAFDYDLSNFEEWTVEFKQTADGVTTTVYSLETGVSHGSNTAYVEYSDSKLTAKYIAEGSYDVELTGSYTPAGSSTKYQVFGATSVTIKGNGTGSAKVLVGPKKNSSGALALSFADSGAFYNTDLYSSDSGLAYGVKATLESIDGEPSYFVTSSKTAGTTESSKGENGETLSIVYSVGTSAAQIPALSFSLAGSNIPSGWYSLSFSVVDSGEDVGNYRVYLPEHPDAFVEIADGCTTASSDVSISVDTVKTYYATNDTSSYNGLSAASRANLNTLLDTLSKALPSEGTIRIFVDGTPDFDIKAFSGFKTEIAKTTKTVYIYNADKLEVLTMAGSGGDTAATTLLNSVELTPNGTENTLAVDSIELTSDVTLTLNNNATVSAGKISLDRHTVKVYAVSSTTTDGATTIEDNLSSYSDTPFLTADGDDISSSISLYEYGSDKVSEKYAVVSTGSTTEVSTGSTTISYYIKPAGSSEIKAASFAGTVSISAAYSSDKGTVYTTGKAIPYTDDTLTFTLENFTDSATVAWYLNNKDTALEGTVSEAAPYTYTASFNPYTQGGFNIDGTNTVSCYVTISGETYLAEMKFTFSATRSAVVWYDRINSTSDASAAYALKQVYDYKSAAASELVTAPTSSDATLIYCFDSALNFYTAVSDSDSIKGVEITRYSIEGVETGLYSTAGEAATNTDKTSITGTPIDMTYDASTEYFFILTTDGNSAYTLHKILPFATDGEYNYASGTVSIKNSSGGTVTPVQIAVSGDYVYVAGDDCNIYVGTGAGGGDSVTPLVLDFNSTPIAELASDSVLSGNSKATDSYLSITDLQIGDGLGNDSSTLYALAREYNIYSDGSSEAFTCYSRGALIPVTLKIEDSAVSATVGNAFGWSTKGNKISDSSGLSGTLYGPDSSSKSVEFYGPTHFAAVSPKKLVILDDGVAYSGNQGVLDNKDSLVEFDISKTTLTRGASVSATKVIGSGFTR